jgi:carbamoyltransferase
MHILGISCYYHDAAAALLKDGMLVAAVEEERLSRKKHDFGYPERAIRFCLEQAGISSRDLDYVVFYEKPLVKFDRILMSALATFPRSWHGFRESMITWFKDKLWIKRQIQSHLELPPEKILFVDHHASHAASAFFCSPFEEAAVLTCDGVGEWTTASIGQGRASWNGDGGNGLRILEEMRFPHSLGLFYSAFTAFLGFEVNEGEYKVMGMAPYGEPRYVDKMRKLLHLRDDGSFWVDMNYFCYHYSAERMFNAKFEELLGSPRDPKSEFVTSLTDPTLEVDAEILRRNQYYADVAASVQRMTEEAVLKLANHAHERTGSKKLCIAGGVALNSVANGRLVREGPFEDIYIQPAAGDSGGALGAALYAYHVLLGKPRQFTMEHAYWGQAHSAGAIREAVDGAGLAYKAYDDEEGLIESAVSDLVRGKVIGWFQGRFEWGPRALGNRSILADPRRSEMKNIVNSKIKFREPFRPFAPAILEERVSDYFTADLSRQYPARFMLLVQPFRQEVADRVPAVNHMGTGRLQTVRKEWNDRYHAVLKGFEQATGVPVILNTSFNLRGEPIVADPTHALSTFLRSGLDVLIMENFRIEKQA